MTDYELLKGLKVCIQCMRYSAAPGKVRCEVCLAQNAESAENRRKKENQEQTKERKQKHKEYLKRIRQERKERGVCIFCEKPLSTGSTVYCIDHKIKNQRNNKKRYSGIARSERKNYGICYLCGSESMQGKSVCKICYEKCCENLPKLRNSSNYDYWKKENRMIFLNKGEV